MRHILPILLSLSVGTPMLFGELSQDSNYVEGMDALAVHLPDVAVNKFQAALDSTELADADRVTITLRVAESQIRSFDGVGAERTLESEVLAGHQDRPFWLAHAYFAQGRHREAASLFESVSRLGPMHRRGAALLALSELYRSLNEPERAFEVLEKATESRKLSASVNLKLVELYVEKDQFDAAQQLLEKLEPQRSNNQFLKSFLQSKLYLKTKQAEQAREMLVGLQGEEKLSRELKNVIDLSLVDVEVQVGEVNTAVSMLLKMISENPQSPYIHLVFNRLYYTVESGVATDGIEEQLKQWIENPESNQDNEADEASVTFKYPERDAFSRFVLAIIMGMDDSAERIERANSLFDSLRKYHPGQVVARASYIPTSYNFIKLEKRKEALDTLDLMRQNAFTSSMKARAITTRALIMNQAGDSEKAIEELAKIILLENSGLVEEAQINVALIRVMLGDEEAFGNASKIITNPSIRIGLEYEWTLQKIQKGEMEARGEMVSLLNQFPDHGMATQAKVELINHSISFQPLDTDLAIKLLEGINAAELEIDVRDRLELLSGRVKLLSGDWEKLIELYNAQLAEQGDEMKGKLQTQKLQLSLAEAYFRNGDFIKARKEFNKIIEIESSPFIEHAYFFSALAAKKEGTPQGKLEGAKLLEKVVEMDGPYGLEAVIQLARVKIDAQQLGDARELLELRLSDKGLSDQQTFECKLLLADINVRLGAEAGDKKHFKRADLLYSDLIKLKKGEAKWSNRLFYHKGQAQEALEEDKKTALETYFNIINLSHQQNKSQPLEWDWYYKAGIRATNILVQQERWKAAVSLLEKMAGYYGPKSNVLLERASKLKLKHHIW